MKTMPLQETMMEVSGHIGRHGGRRLENGITVTTLIGFYASIVLQQQIYNYCNDAEGQIRATVTARPPSPFQITVPAHVGQKSMSGGVIDGDGVAVISYTSVQSPHA